MNHKEIVEILDMLATLQEHLLSLPDDMLLDIDSRDNQSLEQGSRSIMSFNDALDKFTDNASVIEANIKSYFKLNPEEEEMEKESTDQQKRASIIKDLDRTVSHSLEENFTFKRPYGFILEDTAYKGIKTWRGLYLHVLMYLNEHHPNEFIRLPEEKQFTSIRGNPIISRDETKLRAPKECGAGIYVEINLSSNHIRNNIKKLLDYFKIGSHSIKIYLRDEVTRQR